MTRSASCRLRSKPSCSACWRRIRCARSAGTRVKRVQMRFIAATNQDLEEKVRTGGFRKDLYYRLTSLVIRVPSLRERVEDIPVIARHLVSRFSREMRKEPCYLESSALAELVGYWWPGNVRELRNVLERAVMVNATGSITGAEIKALLPSGKQAIWAGDLLAYMAQPYREARRKILTEFTRAYLKARLAAHDGNITRAAEDSGIPRQQFSVLLKRYDE